MGRRDVDQVAHALHVRLPGQHPEVADEHRPDLLHHLLVVFLDRQSDPVGTTDGYADKLAFEESDPIGELFVGVRILVLRDDGSVHQRGVLGGLIEREGDHRAAVDVALKDLRGHRRLDLDILGHHGRTTKLGGATRGAARANPTTANATIRAPGPAEPFEDTNGRDRDMVV